MNDVNSYSAKPVSTAISGVGILFPRVLKTAWLQLLVIHFLRSITSEFFTYAASMIQARGREEIALLATAVILQFLIEMAWSALWVFVVIDAVKRAMGSPAAGPRELFRRLNQLLIEGVRAIAAILYRLPFLIVPGLIEFVRLAFVPHVVLLDEDYQAGRLDALERSRKLTKGRWILLIFSALLLVCLNTYLEIVAQGSQGDLWMWERPLSFSVTTFMTLFTTLVYELFIVALFFKLSMMQPSRQER